MHQSSKHKIGLFAKSLKSIYTSDTKVKILDIGAVEPSYRDLFEEEINCQYETMNVIFNDNDKSNMVNIYVKEAYSWTEIADDSYDVIVCGQVFEHVEYFWITLLEIQRILKTEAFFALTAPSHWKEHPAPYDCYRFYADGFYAMAKYINFEPIYCYSEHPEFNPRRIKEDCDALLIAKKKTTDVTLNKKYRQIHSLMQEIIPQNYIHERSRNCKFIQSSVSQQWKPDPWSSPVSGICSGSFSFHTHYEDSPWCILDMKQAGNISMIKVFNRGRCEQMAYDIDIYSSEDMINWQKVHANQEPFGGIYDNSPLSIEVDILARYVQIRKRGAGILHLDQIQVFGKI